MPAQATQSDRHLIPEATSLLSHSNATSDQHPRTVEYRLAGVAMEPDRIVLTHGGSERLDAVSALLGRVFDKDPVLRYMLMDFSQKEYLEYLQPYWRRLCKAAVLNDASITEADGWKAAAVLMPPGKTVDNFWTLLPAGFLNVLYRVGISGCMRMLNEFAPATDAAKKKGLKGEKRYYYIFAIGTEYEHQGKGLARAIIKHHQDQARAGKIPVWLEATTRRSREVYLKMGFEDVETITLGKGKVGDDGISQKDGPGVPLFAMVWWPKPQEQ